MIVSWWIAAVLFVSFGFFGSYAYLFWLSQQVLFSFARHHHIRIPHDAKPLKCQWCPSSYSSYYSFFFFVFFFFLFFFLFLLLLTAVCDVDVNISNQVAVIQLSTLLLLLFLLLVVLLQLPPFVVVLVSGCCCPKRPVLRQQCFKMALPESRGNKTTEGKTQRFPDSSMLTLSLEENPIKNLTRPNVLDHGETMSTCLSEREATVPSCSHIWPCFLGTSLIHCFEAKHRKPCNWRCPILANQSESLKLRGKASIREVALHTILHTTKNSTPPRTCSLAQIG